MKLTQNPGTPIGEELGEPVPRGGVRQVIGYLRSLVDTMMAAHDRLYVDQHDFDQRTIGIDTLGVGTTEFDLSLERALELFDSGRAAAEEFLERVPGGDRDTVVPARSIGSRRRARGDREPARGAEIT